MMEGNDCNISALYCDRLSDVALTASALIKYKPVNIFSDKNVVYCENYIQITYRFCVYILHSF